MTNSIDDMVSDLRSALRNKDTDESIYRKTERRLPPRSDSGTAESDDAAITALPNRSSAPKRAPKRATWWDHACSPLGITLLLVALLSLGGGGTAVLLSKEPPVVTSDAARVQECLAMGKRYGGATGTDFAALQTLIGIPADAGRNDIEARCLSFSKVVTRMDSMAPRPLHSFLCRGTRYQIDQRFAFIPLADRSGVKMISLEKTQRGTERMDVKTYPVPPDRISMAARWQFYNYGDGCLVVGHTEKHMNFTVDPAQNRMAAADLPVTFR